MFLHSAHLYETVRSIQNGTPSLTDYIHTVCDRIDQVDTKIESLLPESNRRERLLSEASALEERYPDPTHRPPLFGAVVGVKDIFHVDEFVTRAGSTVPPESFAGEEAVCVQQLRAAGALIAGKTVTTEFAYFEPGPTRNPHNLNHTPGGSSSGSAAAVAAGLCPLALGTQTIGSVIRPAAFCGIVGYKPTYERIASAGLVYFSRTVDHVGLFTQDVESMTLAASVLCQGWQADLVVESVPILGVPDGPYLEQTDKAALTIFEERIAQLAQAGVVVKRIPMFQDISDLNQLHRQLAFGEFAREHRTIYAEHAHLYRPRTAEIIEIGQTIDDAELTGARKNCETLRTALSQQMEQNGFDLWVCPPALGSAPEGIHATGDPNMNLPWTHAGMPAMTIPTDRADNGLPLGLQLVAQFGQDERLFGWAKTLVQRIALAAMN